MLSCVGDHILQEFNTLYLTRFRTYKIALPPQTKSRKGGGLRQINTCCKVPLRVNFLHNDIGIAFYPSNLSTQGYIGVGNGGWGGMAGTGAIIFLSVLGPLFPTPSPL